MKHPDMLEQPAVFSPCRRWRYTLRRIWTPELWGPSVLPDADPLEPGVRMVAFIGLNPSTADEENNDPTVARCVNYAKKWGYGGMYMLNIFAWRSTDPRGLLLPVDPVGLPWNDKYIKDVVQSPAVSIVVCCWGNHGAMNGRGWEMVRMLRTIPGLEITRLGPMTLLGHPRHPLYLKGNLKPEPL